jgi:hypothetical protein
MACHFGSLTFVFRLFNTRDSRRKNGESPISTKCSDYCGNLLISAIYCSTVGIRVPICLYARCRFLFAEVIVRGDSVSEPEWQTLARRL